MSEAFAAELDAAFDLALARALHVTRSHEENIMPPIASTTDLALAAWWWSHGLEFSRCVATDSGWAELEFDDPDGLAPQLRAEFRQQFELREVLSARRRLCYAIRTARVSPSRIATRQNIDHPNPGLRPALRALATGRVRGA
jgi:hypothetical protein